MTKRKELGIGTHAFGQAGVHGVIHQLILNGFSIFQPITDDHGVDLMVYNGRKVARIQVKAASLQSRIYHDRNSPSSPFYQFEFTRVRATYAGGITSSVIEFDKETDFVVLVGIEDGKYWIVPSERLNDRRSVRISLDPRSKEIDWEEARKMKEDGQTYQAIGDHFGISGPAVFDRLKGNTGAAGSDFIRQIRSYENRWDLISDFLNQ